MTDHITIRPASSSDLDACLALLPQLADFDVPEHRNPLHLWEGDAKMYRQVSDEQLPNSFAQVAIGERDEVLGLILITMRDEMLSHAPSAHLEAIVVAPEARGVGLGRRLLKHAEELVMQRGAKSLTLHVFANNHRARTLYDSSGFDSEMLRAIKWLD